MKSANDVKKEIVTRYDKDPKNWQMYVGRDRRGHYDLLVTHNSDAWVIKEEQINPSKFVGFGVKTRREKLDLMLKENPNSFGIRSVSGKQIDKLTHALKNKESVKDILSKIMSSTPIRPQEIQGPLVFQGPIMYSSKPMSSISEQQRKLDIKLRKELENLVNRRYSQVYNPYM
jgi:hypothetical protein